MWPAQANWKILDQDRPIVHACAGRPRALRDRADAPGKLAIDRERGCLYGRNERRNEVSVHAYSRHDFSLWNDHSCDPTAHAIRMQVRGGARPGEISKQRREFFDLLRYSFGDVINDKTANPCRPAKRLPTVIPMIKTLATIMTKAAGSVANRTAHNAAEHAAVPMGTTSGKSETIRDHIRAAVMRATPARVAKLTLRPRLARTLGTEELLKVKRCFVVVLKG